MISQAETFQEFRKTPPFLELRLDFGHRPFARFDSLFD